MCVCVYNNMYVLFIVISINMLLINIVNNVYLKIIISYLCVILLQSSTDQSTLFRSVSQGQGDYRVEGNQYSIEERLEESQGQRSSERC